MSTKKPAALLAFVGAVAPVVSNLEYKGEGTDMVLSFDVTDASLLAAIDLRDPADGLWFYRHIFTDDEATTAADGTRAYHVEIPFKDIAQAWTDQGGSGTADACTSPEGGHWVKDGAGWWYACTDGTSYLKDGWFTINGSDYLFGPSGYMATGFLKRANGDWVYADQDGAFVGGWVRDGGSWYYLDPSSKFMKTGWVADGGSWYYLSPSGAMLAGTQVINGRTYVFDANGIWIG